VSAVGSQVSRHVVATGADATAVAERLADQLRAPDLRFALAFVDWRLDPHAFGRAFCRAVSAPAVGCTTVGVIAREPGVTGAALGFYGDWVRVGVGIASDLAKSALAHSRDAVRQAAAALGTTPTALDGNRHVALTVVDGLCGFEEGFCIGSAAVAPQIRFAGGCASCEPQPGKSFVFHDGEVMSSAGIVVILESALPFTAVTSLHLVPTDVKTVVTAAAGRLITELDGQPAATRLGELLDKLGAKLDPGFPSEYSFARFLDGVPYVRSIIRTEGQHIHVASAVETGQVLRLMRPGDLVTTTKRDLEAAARRVGGSLSALLVFSCIGRKYEADARGLSGELAQLFGAYPTIGFQSFGEQTGMLLVNHTLTGIAIGDGEVEA
jgi:hypothetical protein